jgi:uncharacterized protein YdcH (DUF465 family)
MNHSMTDSKEIIIMLIIMFISGLLSSMNNWVDKLSDVQFHLNDIYMSLLMCGWSLILMGIYYIHYKLLVIGIVLTFIIMYCIRTQLFIDKTHYLKGMIPHHSMAVLMSKRLLEKNLSLEPEIKQLATNIISSQETEINLMKKYA